MKQVKIYTRTILERTGFKKYPYKEIKQISLIIDGHEFRNHYEDINNKKLKKPFELVLKTTSEKKVKAFASKLSKTDADKWLKCQIDDILNTYGQLL